MGHAEHVWRQAMLATCVAALALLAGGTRPLAADVEPPTESPAEPGRQQSAPEEQTPALAGAAGQQPAAVGSEADAAKRDRRLVGRWVAQSLLGKSGFFFMTVSDEVFGQALERMESRKDWSALGDLSALVVNTWHGVRRHFGGTGRFYVSHPWQAYFIRGMRARFGAKFPVVDLEDDWADGPAFKKLYEFIRDHRKELPASAMLDREMKQAAAVEAEVSALLADDARRLVERLRSGTPREKSDALDLVNEDLVRGSKAVRDALLALLSGDDERIAVWAVERLSDAADDEVMKAVVGLLADPRDAVKRRALMFIRWRGCTGLPEGAVALLLPLLKFPDVRIREEVCQVLSNQPQPGEQALKALKDVVDGDAVKDIREAAIEALMQVDEAHLDEHIVTLLSMVKDEAELLGRHGMKIGRAFAQTKDQAVAARLRPLVVKALQDEEAFTVHRVLVGLSYAEWLTDEAVVAQLLVLLNQADENLPRNLIYMVLSRARVLRTEVVRALEEALQQTEDEGWRQWLQQLIDQMKEGTT